jgi:multidrug efflux pump subunit AcrA (membrane-fusion protein)
MRRWVTGALAIAAIVAATCIYLLRVSDKQPVDASSRIIRPETRVITNSVNATGTVRLRVGSEVRVGSQLSGIVKKLHVTVGSHVRASDVIAEIDDTPIQARLADAEAQVEIDLDCLEGAHARIWSTPCAWCYPS